MINTNKHRWLWLLLSLLPAISYATDNNQSIPASKITPAENSILATVPLEEGYVFSISKIDENSYQRLQQQHNKKAPEPTKIVDGNSLRQALGSSVILETQTGQDYDSDEDYEYTLIKQITTKSGKTISFDPEQEQGLFVAYYPEYHFILLEGGHSIDEGYDLLTGEDIYQAGNPATQQLSPDQNIRISSVFEGQECSAHVIQIRIGEQYKRIGLFPDNVCYFVSSFWQDNQTFYYAEYGYGFSFESNTGPMDYYKMTIKKATK